MKNLNDIFNVVSTKGINSQLKIARERLMDGDSGSAYEHLMNLLYDELSELPVY